MKQIIIFALILLIGCSKEVLICENITNTINHTVYINRNITITEKCNITNNTVKFTYTGTTSKELELIRRINFLENQQDNWIINETECMPHNKTEEDLENCENKIDMHERDIEELEDELENCTESLCGYNSTEC